jgi:hypothetical protein
MTALTDHGFGFGRDDVWAMDLAAARADMKRASAQEVERQSVSSTVTHPAGRTLARFIFSIVTNVLDTPVSSKRVLRRLLCSQAKYYVISKQWKGRADLLLALAEPLT